MAFLTTTGKQGIHVGPLLDIPSNALLGRHLARLSELLQEIELGTYASGVTTILVVFAVFEWPPRVGRDGPWDYRFERQSETASIVTGVAPKVIVRLSVGDRRRLCAELVGRALTLLVKSAGKRKGVSIREQSLLEAVRATCDRFTAESPRVRSRAVERWLEGRRVDEQLQAAIDEVNALYPGPEAPRPNVRQKLHKDVRRALAASAAVDSLWEESGPGGHRLGYRFPHDDLDLRDVEACNKTLLEWMERDPSFNLVGKKETIDLLLLLKDRLDVANRWNPERIYLWEMFDEVDRPDDPGPLPPADQYALLIGECPTGSIISEDGSLLLNLAHTEAPDHWDLYICDYPDATWCYAVTHEPELPPMFVRLVPQRNEQRK